MSKEVLDYIISNIPGVEALPKIIEREDESGITYIIDINKDLMPLVIGRSGRNIKAIREIVSLGNKASSGKKIQVKLKEV